MKPGSPDPEEWLDLALQRFRGIARRNASGYTEMSATYALMRVLEAVIGLRPDHNLTEYIANEVFAILGLSRAKEDRLFQLLLLRLAPPSSSESGDQEAAELIRILKLPKLPKDTAIDFAKSAYRLLLERRLSPSQ